MWDAKQKQMRVEKKSGFMTQTKKPRGPGEISTAKEEQQVRTQSTTELPVI